MLKRNGIGWLWRKFLKTTIEKAGIEKMVEMTGLDMLILNQINGGTLTPNLTAFSRITKVMLTLQWSRPLSEMMRNTLAITGLKQVELAKAVGMPMATLNKSINTTYEIKNEELKRKIRRECDDLIRSLFLDDPQIDLLVSGRIQQERQRQRPPPRLYCRNGHYNSLGKARSISIY